MNWKTLGSKLIYKNPWMKVREDKIIHPNGKEGIYSVVDIASGIFTVALTQNDEIYMIRQLRYTTGIDSWELPGGGQREDEKPEETAKRELIEEAGIKAKKWEYVGKCQPLNGSSSQIDHIFVATDLEKVKGKHQKKEGISDVKKFPITKVIDMIKKGEISDGQTIAHLTMALLHLGYKLTK